MLQGSWLENAANQLRRYYAITREGREALAALQAEWRRFSQAVNLVVEPEPS